MMGHGMSFITQGNPLGQNIAFEMNVPDREIITGNKMLKNI